MIYEMVNDSLVSLESQWRELAAVLKQLAESDEAKPLKTTLDRLQNQATNEAQRIKNAQSGLQAFRRANDLFPNAIQTFDQSETEYNDLQNQFAGIAPLLPQTVDVAFCKSRIQRLGDFIARALQEFEEVTSIQGERFNLHGIKGSVENLTSYPLLTSDMGGVAPSAPAQPAGGGVAPLQRTVDNALRQVLGRVPKPGDTRSFQAALSQSFRLIEIEGRVEFTWTPRSYAGQTELGGGVTGAQASLYTRAKVTLDNALPLLDGLAPLLPDPDDELIDAAQAIVRSDLIELVNELGTEGGPRRARVDGLFDSLLNQPIIGLQGKAIKGHLAYLEDVYGLSYDRVNTLEEETSFTNFVVLKDYVTSLYQSWSDFSTKLFGRDLGTRLVLLSRALSVTTESVQEVYAAMDSVFVGAAERQVAAFQDESNRPVLVEELLSWITSFSSEEAPRLVHEGGRRGVAAIIPTVQRLDKLVQRLLQSIPNDPLLPPGLRHPRVRQPLQELRSYLQRTESLAQDVWSI